MKNILPSFTLVGMFSLFPLLKREDQIMPYYLTIFLFYTINAFFCFFFFFGLFLYSNYSLIKIIFKEKNKN